ncbi:hypothetical protein GDO81_008381 [Engystomops pustulosus]|uniref:Uncharacterized protein n=1 Tax=Engystomops pustulosus TaxID=76066 RepID=A0AAV7CEH0_ENGPU|nr:hypothetical protein GDO81_008381 [Engystomops pustulosus]
MLMSEEKGCGEEGKKKSRPSICPRGSDISGKPRKKSWGSTERLIPHAYCRSKKLFPPSVGYYPHFGSIESGMDAGFGRVVGSGCTQEVPHD